MEQKPVRARRTKQQILELLEQFDQAGSSVVAFCNQHQISSANFHKWKSRYKTIPQLVKPMPGFARVKVASPMQSSALFAEGDAFIFINRTRTHLKLLVWEPDGFTIVYRRLKRGTFEVPAFYLDQNALSITAGQLHCILKGIQLSSVKYRKRYKQNGMGC